MVRGGVSIKERKALVKIAKFLSSLKTSGEGKALLARYPNLGGGAAKLLAELKKRSPSSSRLSSLLKRLGKRA